MAPTNPYKMRQIATGCFYLLTNKGTLHFPGSDRSKPSKDVVVDLATSSPYRDSDRTYFPFKLGWAVWHDAIVPVLESKDVQVLVVDNPSLRVHQNSILVRLGLYDELIAKIESYLLDSLVTHGYLPAEFGTGTVTVEETSSTCPPPPSEVVWNPQVPVTDPNLTHPDGTPKQSYPVVDTDLLPSSC